MKDTLIFFMLLLSFVPLVFALDSGTKVGSAELYNDGNVLLNDQNSKIAMIIPAIMVIVTIVCLLIDFGVIGVAAGGILALVALYFMQLIPITLPGMISMVILGIILIFKLRA